MSPNMLLRIEQWIMESKILNERDTKKFIKFLIDTKVVKGSLLQPGAVMRHINISTEVAYKLFKLLIEKNIIVENYELYCHDCDKYGFRLYEYYGDIPKEIECEGCFETLKRETNTIVIFKVINDAE